MWAVVVIMLQALSGPQTHVVTKPEGEAYLFATEKACQDSVAAAIPSKITKEKNLKDFQEGYRRYVCVRVSGMDLPAAK